MKKIVFIMALLMLVTACTACGGSSSANEVTVDSVASICGMGSVGLCDRFAGIVSPQGETKIKRSMESPIGEILVSVGDSVTEGQVLFTYDTEQINLDIQSARLELEKYANEVKANREEIAQLETEKQAASEDQKLEYTNEIQIRNANIREAESSMASVNGRIANLQKQLENASVKSTVSGKVQSINENGGYDDMGNELPFMTVVQTDGYRIKAYVNEMNMASLIEGTPVIVRSRVSDDVWYGSVSMIDLDNPAQNSNYYGDDETAMSSKYPFYVELESGEGLMLGQHVYIEPDLGQSQGADDALYLPSYYIVDPDGKAFVWAENDKGKLEKRSLTLGDYDPELDVYPVLDGLALNDYISFPDESLSAGMTCLRPEDVTERLDEEMYVEDVG